MRNPEDTKHFPNPDVFKPGAGKIDAFRRITTEDARLCNAIADRAVSVARAHCMRTRGRDLSQGDIDWMQLAMDIQNVHVHRGLRLTDFLFADATSFQNDLAMIHRYTDRRAGGINPRVPLKFAVALDGERPQAYSGLILPQSIVRH